MRLKHLEFEFLNNNVPKGVGGGQVWAIALLCRHFSWRQLAVPAHRTWAGDSGHWRARGAEFHWLTPLFSTELLYNNRCAGTRVGRKVLPIWVWRKPGNESRKKTWGKGAVEINSNKKLKELNLGFLTELWEKVAMVLQKPLLVRSVIFFFALFSFWMITLFKVADFDENYNLIVVGSPINFPVMVNKWSDSCYCKAFKTSTTKKKR